MIVSNKSCTDSIDQEMPPRDLSAFSHQISTFTCLGKSSYGFPGKALTNTGFKQLFPSWGSTLRVMHKSFFIFYLKIGVMTPV